MRLCSPSPPLPQITSLLEAMKDEVFRGPRLKSVRRSPLKSPAEAKTVLSRESVSDSIAEGIGWQQVANRKRFACISLLFLWICVGTTLVESNQSGRVMERPDWAPPSPTRTLTKRHIGAQTTISLNDASQPVSGKPEPGKFEKNPMNAANEPSEILEGEHDAINKQVAPPSENGERAMRADLVSKVIHKATKTKHKTKKKLHKLFHKTVHKVGHAFHQTVHSVHG